MMRQTDQAPAARANGQVEVTRQDGLSRLPAHGAATLAHKRQIVVL
jgi:hypothetical protein